MCGSKPVCDTVGLLQQGVVVIIIIVDLQPPERPRPWLAASAQRPEQNWGGEKRKQIIACSSNGKAEKMLGGSTGFKSGSPFFPPTSTQYNKKTRYSYSPVIVVSTSRTPTTRPITRGRSTQASAANRHRAWVRVPLLGCARTDSRRHMSA